MSSIFCWENGAIYGNKKCRKNNRQDYPMQILHPPFAVKKKVNTFFHKWCHFSCKETAEFWIIDFDCFLRMVLKIHENYPQISSRRNVKAFYLNHEVPRQNEFNVPRITCSNLINQIINFEVTPDEKIHTFLQSLFMYCYIGHTYQIWWT